MAGSASATPSARDPSRIAARPAGTEIARGPGMLQLAAGSVPRSPVSSEVASLTSVLKQFFGFTAFRPLQEEIIRDALAGRDVVALLPTGGGKSLCFQLPAVVRGGLTVVVSPLIALMKDQVDALGAAGVPATFLNSSLGADEVRRRMAQLAEGRYRLLYVAPERLMIAGLPLGPPRPRRGRGRGGRGPLHQRLGPRLPARVPPPRRAARRLPRGVDHGALGDRHRARPGRHRDLAAPPRPALLRGQLRPAQPALPGRAQGRRRPSSSSRSSAAARTRRASSTPRAAPPAERLAARLREAGVSAAAYHAGMEGQERARTQEAFMRDEVRVVCATVAFGMGIDKPNVRFVVHHDVPKDLESYYQETGRAGRDGLPERVRAPVPRRRRGEAGRTSSTRRPTPRSAPAPAPSSTRWSASPSPASAGGPRILAYFGETRAEGPCGACDNCLSPRERYDGTLPAQKLLSCVLRIRQKSDFSVGLAHVAAVLVGADNEKIRRLGHTELSTYGIGKELRPRRVAGDRARALPDRPAPPDRGPVPRPSRSPPPAARPCPSARPSP